MYEIASRALLFIRLVDSVLAENSTDVLHSLDVLR